MRRAVLLILPAVLIAGAAAAQRSDPSRIIAARQVGMKDVGKSFKAINDQIRSGSPDRAVVKASADRLSAHARSVAGWFPRGSGAAPGVKSAAKAEIWASGTTFAAQTRAFAGATAALSRAAAGSGDLAAPARAVGQTCKGCHDRYKVAND